MLLISNRGNLNGPDIKNENSPEYIEKALEKGYHVVADTWIVPVDSNSAKFFFGTVSPQYPVSATLINNPKLILRAHDLQTLNILIKSNLHAVLYSGCTQLTTRNLIWNSVDERVISPSSVVYLPEIMCEDSLSLTEIPKAGICSNFIEKFS